MPFFEMCLQITEVDEPGQICIHRMRGCGKEVKNVEKRTESLNASRLGLFLKRYNRCSSTHNGVAF